MNDVQAVADDVACLYLGQMAAQVEKSTVSAQQVVEFDHDRQIRRHRIAARDRHGRCGMTAQVTDVDVPAAGDTGGIGQAVRDYWARVRGGDIGSLPAVLGLIVLVVLFGTLEGSTFLSVFNFANLINQSAAIIVLAMGLVFVLLLGEIDLSAGFAAGTSAANPGCGA